jgi:hypothetical protein
MKTAFAILAALAYLAALTAAEEPAAKAEATPMMRNADSEVAPVEAEGEAPKDQEYYGGGGYYGHGGGYYGHGGGYYGGGYGHGGYGGHW